MMIVWTPEQQRELILEGLAEGRSLRSICKDDGMPSVSTVFRWCADEEVWREQYAQARASGDDAMAEDIQEIADRSELDPQDKKVRIDARKWLLAKRQPKKYGDKIDVTSGGERVNQLGDDAIAVRAAAMIASALERQNDGED